jgi:hypothetical protein
MTEDRPLATLVALSLTLAACHSPGSESQPTPTPTATVTKIVPVPVPASSPSSAAASGKGIGTRPDPALCGADRLMPYLNLLPTSTARGEIARTVGHDRVRYVEAHEAETQEIRPDRLTVTLGVDGRIKKFSCG